MNGYGIGNILAAVILNYLRDNLQFGQYEDGHAAVEMYFAAAVDVGIVPASRALRFFEA